MCDYLGIGKTKARELLAYSFDEQHDNMRNSQSTFLIYYGVQCVKRIEKAEVLW